MVEGETIPRFTVDIHAKSFASVSVRVSQEYGQEYRMCLSLLLYSWTLARRIPPNSEIYRQTDKDATAAYTLHAQRSTDALRKNHPAPTVTRNTPAASLRTSMSSLPSPSKSA